jgi:hypothetical protein
MLLEMRKRLARSTLQISSVAGLGVSLEQSDRIPVRLELVLIVTLVKVLAFLAVKSLMLGIECRGQRGLRIPAVFVERRRGGLAVCGAAQSFSTADGR